MTKWLDMKYAPKDGTEIIVWVPDFQWVGTAHYCEATGLWPHDENYTEEGEPCNVGLPTKWQHKPEPPKE